MTTAVGNPALQQLFLRFSCKANMSGLIPYYLLASCTLYW